MWSSGPSDDTPPDAPHRLHSKVPALLLCQTSVCSGLRGRDAALPLPGCRALTRQAQGAQGEQGDFRHPPGYASCASRDGSRLVSASVQSCDRCSRTVRAQARHVLYHGTSCRCRWLRPLQESEAGSGGGAGTPSQHKLRQNRDSAAGGGGGKGGGGGERRRGGDHSTRVGGSSALALLMELDSKDAGATRLCLQRVAWVAPNLPHAPRLHRICLMPLGCTESASCPWVAPNLPHAPGLHRICLMPLGCTESASCHAPHVMCWANS